MDRGAWWTTVHGVMKNWTRLSDFTFTFHFRASEKEMATYSSVLAWRIPWTAEPGGLPSMGSHRVGHDWSDLAVAAAALCDTVSFSLYISYSLLYVFKCFYVWYMCLQILYLLVELIPWSLHNVFICLLLQRVKVFFIWYKYCYPGFNFHFHFSHPLIFSLCSSLDLKWVSYRHYMCLTRWRNMTYRSYFFI